MELAGAPLVMSIVGAVPELLTSKSVTLVLDVALVAVMYVLLPV